MFSTPTIRIHSQENSDSVMRKPQLGSTRKAFQDCGVNRASHLKSPLGKKPTNLLQSLLSPAPKVQQSEEPAAIWEMEMLREPPTYEINKFETCTLQLFQEKANILTPPPSPLKDADQLFVDDFDFIRLPPAKFHLVVDSDNSSLLSDDDFIVEKPIPLDFNNYL